MNEAPKGKIGRLPKAIQEQVNRRLEHGEKAADARRLAQCPAGSAGRAGGGICGQNRGPIRGRGADGLLGGHIRAGCPSRKFEKFGFVSLKQPLDHRHIDALRVTDPRAGDLGNPPSRRFLRDQGGRLGWFRNVEEAGRNVNQCGVLPKRRHVAGRHAGWSDGLPF